MDVCPNRRRNQHPGEHDCAQPTRNANRCRVRRSSISFRRPNDDARALNPCATGVERNGPDHTDSADAHCHCPGAEGDRSFNDRCAKGIEPNEKRIRERLDNSLMLVTALNPHIGYEKAAQISLKAYREELTLREAALKLGFLTAKQFDEWVRPEDMTHPLEPEKTNA